MIRLRTIRFIALALAFSMRVPTGSAFASLMTVSCIEPIEIDWVSSESTPADVPVPEAPIDQMPVVWSMIYGLAGSMESSVNSVTGTSVASCLNHENFREVISAATDSCRIPEDRPPPDVPVAELLKVPIGKFVI